jgi:glutathionylspermidine synthase
MVHVAGEMTAAAPLAGDAYADVRRRTIFECCKWDPQLGDVSVLCPFPIILSRETWQQLSRWAEALAGETICAERELLDRPELHARLSFPRRVRRALRAGEKRCAEIARVMRFDFHLTTDGWRISEVNSDVPGGFIEAAGFTRLVAEHYPDARMTGDPARAMADELARALGRGATIGLVHATAYTDDRQVMEYLAREIGARGMTPHCVGPTHVRWSDGRARIASDFLRADVDAIVRFFPGEWLVNLPRKRDWRHYFADSVTPLCNPATALLSQSKRLPLVWDGLKTPMPTWRALLPETRDPRDVPWRRDESWIVKPALGRVGEGIGMAGVTPAKPMKSIVRGARWFPKQWIAQRRFDAVPIDTPDGPQFPCIGVYTIAGVAAGVYGRIAPRPLIDGTARDVAVLVEYSGYGLERSVRIDDPAAAAV